MEIVTRMLLSSTFKDSSIEDIAPTVREIFKSKDSNYITSMLDCIVTLDLEKTKLQGIADVIEELFLTSKDMGYLCKYLFLIYHRIGNVSLARFYLDLCHNDLGSDNEFTKAAFFYSLNPLQELPNNYHQNNFSRDYYFGDKSFSYSVFSFSDEIGQNMTLLKTRFGSIIFDCGAKCSVDSAIMISTRDLKDFLSATETKKEDVKAIIISHAHLDHYGSLKTMIEFGFDIRMIFMSDGTKKLVSAVAQTTLPLDQIRPISEFFVANNDIRIKSFVNGHIVGSECYLVSFDNINIIYSGDYCIHDQRTVKGLNSVLINNEDAVKAAGIDCLITESTYGHSQQYLKHNDAEKALVHFVDKLLDMGYKVFLPSFAVGRSQELALILNERHSVLLDGLAITVSQIYENISGIAIYNKNTRYNVEAAEDRKRNFDSNNIIIASSGMLAKNSTSCNYVKSFLHSGEKIAIIKTGFINSESFGKSLLDEWKSEDNILLDISLSAHASYDEIIALINELNPRNIVSIHGKGIAHVNAIEIDSVGIEAMSSSTLEKVDNDTVADEVECENNKTEDLNCSPIKGMGEKSIIEDSTVDSKSQNERIQISDSQCRGKLDNVYKAGKSLHDNGISLQKSPAFLTACRLALRFLKLNPYYEKVYAYLSNLKNYEDFWNYIADGVEHGYDFKTEEPFRPVVATNDTLKTEQTVNQAISSDEDEGDILNKDVYENIKIAGNNRIPREIESKYAKIIDFLFADYKRLKWSDFSILKGMCNRCIKQDQQDWNTTFFYLGKPDLSVLENFVKDSAFVRDEVNRGNYDAIPRFVEKYAALLKSIRFHIDSNSYDLSTFKESLEATRDKTQPTTIEVLNLSVGTYNLLYNAKILSYEALLKLTDEELLNIKGMKIKSAREIKTKLAKIKAKSIIEGGEISDDFASSSIERENESKDETNFASKNSLICEQLQDIDFKIDGDVLVKYLGTAENVIIPQGIRTICGGAFHENKAVKSIFLPNGVEVVGKAAFYDCSSLTDISLPNTLKKIEDYAFFSCESLTAIQFPYELVKIGERAFNQCKALTSIEIPDSVESIGSMAFTQCKQLGKVFIGNGVRSIGEYAFSSCKNLNYVKLPEKLETIERGVFRGCHRLTTIIFPQTIRIIGEKAFNNVGFVCCDIPYGVEEIGPQAFYASQELEMIRIPKTIKIINANAFGHLKKLKTVIFDGSESEWVKIEKGDDLFIRSLTDKVQFQ